jgi:DNA-binding response OmpR family regulator
MTLVAPGTMILIVDDDAELRLSVAETLTMEGYEVRAVPTADVARNALALGSCPAAIILDLWLEGMSSGEFVRHLRASRHASVPVLVLSAAPGDTVGLDVDAVARKPIDTACLVSMLDRLVATGRTTPDALPRATAPRPRRKRPRARNAAR